MENQQNSDFGSRLDVFIEDMLKSSPKDFADKTGISLSLIMSYISGTKEPSAAIMLYLYSHHPEDLYWLFTGTSPPPAGNREIVPSIDKLNRLTATLWNSDLPMEIRKFLLKTFVKDYLSIAKGLLDSSQNTAHIKAMYDIFHLELTEAEKKEIVDFIDKAQPYLAAKAA